VVERVRVVLGATLLRTILLFAVSIVRLLRPRGFHAKWGLCLVAKHSGLILSLLDTVEASTKCIGCMAALAFWHLGVSSFLLVELVRTCSRPFHQGLAFAVEKGSRQSGEPKIFVLRILLLLLFPLYCLV
jgi:hypothetical protein